MFNKTVKNIVVWYGQKSSTVTVRRLLYIVFNLYLDIMRCPMKFRYIALVTNMTLPYDFRVSKDINQSRVFKRNLLRFHGI